MLSNKPNKILFVIATAARYSGALSILNQFIKNAFLHSNFTYYIFVDPGYSGFSNDFINFVPINTQKWIKRIRWDNGGLKKWSIENEIEADLIVSLQNTGIAYNDTTPQLIYYHQPIPLNDRKWNFFLKEERTFFFYKYFYPFFILKFIHNNTYFVVQIPSIKESFSHRFAVQKERIYVIRPDTPMENSETAFSEMVLDTNYVNFIYPATPIIYKNHKILVQSLFFLKEQDPLLCKKIRVYFTFSINDNLKLYKMISRYGLQDNIIFNGVKPYNEMLALYKAADALLFPSYIESFGLPLIEAASAGLPIIVSDLPYAKDVIGDYEGSVFVEYNNIMMWSDAIRRICTCRKNKYPFLRDGKSQWDTFFLLINQLIK